MTEIIGPCTLECPESCEIPEGMVLMGVPRPRHNWGDVVNCSNDGCERSFMNKSTGLSHG
jgi:hypothetical protein